MTERDGTLLLWLLLNDRDFSLFYIKTIEAGARTVEGETGEEAMI